MPAHGPLRKIVAFSAHILVNTMVHKLNALRTSIPTVYLSDYVALCACFARGGVIFDSPWPILGFGL